MPIDPAEKKLSDAFLKKWAVGSIWYRIRRGVEHQGARSLEVLHRTRRWSTSSNCMLQRVTFKVIGEPETNAPLVLEHGEGKHCHNWRDLTGVSKTIAQAKVAALKDIADQEKGTVRRHARELKDYAAKRRVINKIKAK